MLVFIYNYYMLIEHFPYINEYFAKQLIFFANNMTTFNRSGKHNDVIFFDNYVVLKTKQYDSIVIKDDEKFQTENNLFNKVIKILHDLRNNGVNVVPILGYACIPEVHDKITYGLGYVLQPKASGNEMYNEKFLTQKKYLLSQTKVLANASQSHYDKFVADVLEILKTRLWVDHLHKDNFFYDKQNGFSFIDINKFLTKTEQAREMKFIDRCFFSPCLNVLTDEMLLGFSENEFFELIGNNQKIFHKCKNAILNKQIMSEIEINKLIEAGDEDNLKNNIIEIIRLGGYDLYFADRLLPIWIAGVNVNKKFDHQVFDNKNQSMNM